MLNKASTARALSCASLATLLLICFLSATWPVVADTIVRQRDVITTALAHGTPIEQASIRVSYLGASAGRVDIYTGNGRVLWSTTIDDVESQRHIVVNWRKRTYLLQPLGTVGPIEFRTPSFVVASAQVHDICGHKCRLYHFRFTGPDIDGIGIGATAWVASDLHQVTGLFGSTGTRAAPGMVLQLHLDWRGYTEDVTALSIRKSVVARGWYAVPTGMSRVHTISALMPLEPPATDAKGKPFHLRRTR